MSSKLAPAPYLATIFMGSSRAGGLSAFTTVCGLLEHLSALHGGSALPVLWLFVSLFPHHSCLHPPQSVSELSFTSFMLKALRGFVSDPEACVFIEGTLQLSFLKGEGHLAVDPTRAVPNSSCLALGQRHQSKFCRASSVADAFIWCPVRYNWKATLENCAVWGLHTAEGIV